MSVCMYIVRDVAAWQRLCDSTLDIDRMSQPRADLPFLISLRIFLGF